jgi:hypothetical protein
MRRRMRDTQKEVMHTNTNHSPTKKLGRKIYIQSISYMRREMRDTQKEVMHTNKNHSPTK